MDDKLEITYQHFQKQYKVQAQIGKGGFGIVRSVTHRRSKLRRALKTIECLKFKDIQAAEQQIQIMGQLQHPLIVKLFEFYQTCYRTTAKGDTTYFGLVMQLGQSSLQQCLRDPTYCFSIADVRQFLANLIEVGAYLQAKELVHCDIKPANIIIFGPKLQFKIADFGLSCHAGRRPNDFGGSLHYCSPILRDFFYNPRNFSKKPLSNAFKDDVYSVGITVHEVLRRIEFNFRQQSSQGLQPQMCMILQQMLRTQQKYRPDFNQLMQYPFIRRQLNMGDIIRENREIRDPDEHFKNVVLRENIDNNVEQITIKKQPNIMQHIGLINRQHFNFNIQIRCLILISKKYILCGSADGRLMVYDCQYERIIELNIRHKKYVSCLAADQNGNIYSAGDDGIVYYINKQKLIELLVSRVYQKQQIKHSLFRSVIKTTKYVLQLNKEQYQIVHKPIDKQNISYLYFISRERFSIGYADGTVLVNWGSKQAHFDNYLGVVTKIKHYQHKLYVAFTSGHMIEFNLRQFKKEYKLHRFSDIVLDFNVTPMRKGYAIHAYTCSGYLQKIQIEELNRPTYEKRMVLKHLIGVHLSQEQCFLLSQDGVVMQDEEQLLKQEGQDWCCLYIDGSTLVCGSMSGEVLLCDLSIP